MLYSLAISLVVVLFAVCGIKLQTKLRKASVEAFLKLRGYTTHDLFKREQELVTTQAMILERISARAKAGLAYDDLEASLEEAEKQRKEITVMLDRVVNNPWKRAGSDFVAHKAIEVQSEEPVVETPVSLLEGYRLFKTKGGGYTVSGTYEGILMKFSKIEKISEGGFVHNGKTYKLGTIADQ
mgnify:CR=1 FL=1